jgi:hypothetical protein
MYISSQHFDGNLAEPLTGADARSRAAQFKRSRQPDDNTKITQPALSAMTGKVKIKNGAWRCVQKTTIGSMAR